MIKKVKLKKKFFYKKQVNLKLVFFLFRQKRDNRKNFRDVWFSFIHCASVCVCMFTFSSEKGGEKASERTRERGGVFHNTEFFFLVK